MIKEPDNNGLKDVTQGSMAYYEPIKQYFNHRPLVQDEKDHYKSITFVTTGIIGYDGGQTTMLHLGTILAKHGYDIYYMSYVPQTKENMERNAEFNYPDYRGTCVPMSEMDKHKSDIWIATLWESAYIIKNKPGYKMYLVQDYEPYFYPYGDQYQMAQYTYEMGIHMVSLGPWCAEMIKKTATLRPGTKIDTINFPVDLSTYTFEEKKSLPKNKKEINLAAYTKTVSPRRAPINLELLLGNTQKILAQKGYKLNIYYFGSTIEEQFINGKNLGKLNHEQLHELYKKVDFGIAPSMTNFSLVPFEMMASGLPFIDFDEGTGASFIPDDCRTHCPMDEYKLSDLLIKMVNNYDSAIDKTMHTYEYLKTISWDKTEKDILNVMQNLENNTNRRLSA